MRIHSLQPVALSKAELQTAAGKLYQAQQQAGAQAGPQPGANAGQQGGAQGDNIQDADFEEVK